MKQRKQISFVVLLIIGLLIGFAIKKVKIGLILGMVLAILASGIVMGGGKKE